MATAATYITHKELKRIFPQLDEFDQKSPIYGWTSKIQLISILLTIVD